MAVVQISKIQIRRGQKNQGSGLPQLASGELAWAIDTRELFIGNGAVSEGAPAVGNTKVLTEYDNILELADIYAYRANDDAVITGESSSNPIKRTLQERLDDIVSVRGFGAVGDGVINSISGELTTGTDDTVSLQRAIDQLYLNSSGKLNPSSRVTLHLEPGVYPISDTIYLPPNATIVGSGSDKTIIYQKENKPTFITVNSSSEPGTPANDSSSTTITQAQNILLQGLTVITSGEGSPSANNITSKSIGVVGSESAKGIVLQSCKNSKFKDLQFKGQWTYASSPFDDDAAIIMNNLSDAVSCNNNIFEECKIYGYSYGVRTDGNVENNSWTDCTFELLDYGIVFGKDLGAPLENNGGPTKNYIGNSIFNEIETNAIWVRNGSYNTSENNKFVLVGTGYDTETGIADELTPQQPVIKYEIKTNKSINDYFSRTAELSYGAGALVPYVPEIEGNVNYELSFENSVNIVQSAGVRAFRLPGVKNQTYLVDYYMISETYDANRTGTLTVTLHGRQNAGAGGVEVSDEYHFIGDEIYADSIEFSARLMDMNSPTDSINDSIDVTVTSTMPVDDSTIFKYTVRARKTNIT